MLAHALKARGWSVFWDRTIPIGKTWRETIEKELQNSRCLIVLWSETSVGSGWVQEEADFGKRRGILLPILIENVEPPMGFRSIQTADLVNWNAGEPTPAFDRLTTDVAALIGTPPVEEPPPPPVREPHAASVATAATSVAASCAQAASASGSSGFPMWAVILLIVIVLVAIWWFMTQSHTPEPAKQGMLSTPVEYALQAPSSAGA